MKKRNVLHFLCVLALVLGLFSGFGAKAHAASAPKVYIGDPWDTANCQVLANGETIDLGSSGKIAYKDGVLTMSNGYTAWGYYNYEPGKYAGIYAEGDLEICVDESYSQIHPFESAYPADAQEFYGIYVTGDLTIVNGSGWNAELSVVTSRASYKTVGIYCGDTLTVKAAGGKTMTLSANGSVPTGNDVSIGSADIDRRGFYNSGISANSAVFLPDTVVKANGAATRAGVPETIGIGNDCSGVCSWGIDATRGIEIYEGSEVTAKGCPIRTCWYEGNGYFVRSLGVRTYVSGDLTVAGSLTAVGGDVSWKDTASPANGWTAESCGASVNGRIWCNCDGFSLAGKGGALTLPSGMAKTVSCGIESPLTDSLSAGMGASAYDGTITASGETAPFSLRADSSAIEGPLLTLSASADGSDAAEIINGSLTQADVSAEGYKYLKAESRVLRIKMDDWTYGEAGSDPVCAFLREPRQYAYSANGGITPATAFRANDYETDRPTEVGLYRIFVKCPGLGLDEPASASFSILPRDLAASTVAFAFGEQGTYNGSSQAVQNVSVTADGALLTNGTDYTITAGRLAKDVADTPLTIMGLGNYAGSVTSENGWSLQKKAPVASDFNMATVGSLTQTYTGSPLSLAVPELKNGKTGIGEGAVRYRVDGVYGETAPVNAGTYDAQAVFEEGQNFAAGTVYLGALTIEKADNPMTVSPGAVTYVNGSLDLSENVSGAKGAVTFAITEALDDCSVTADGAFTAGPVMGDCVVTVRAEGTDNYKPAEKTITVTVSGKELAPLTVSQEGCSFGETLADPVYEDYGVVGETAVTYEGTSYAGEAYSRTTEKPSLPGEYTVYVAYETASKLYIGSAEFLIGYADIGSADIELGTQHAYTGAEQEVVISSVTLNGAALTPGTDYEYYMGYSAVDVGPVTLTLRGKGNYSGTVFTTWSLNKGTYGGETHADVSVSHRSGAASMQVSLPGIPEGASLGEPSTAAGWIYDLSLDDSGLIDILWYSAEPFDGGKWGTELTDPGVVTIPVTGADNYEDYEITVSILYARSYMTHIAADLPPEKRHIPVGTYFDPEGLTVTAYYDDGSSAAVTNYTWSPAAELTFEDSKITISYTEDGVTKTDDVYISVEARQLSDAEVEFGTQATYDGTEHSVVISRVTYFGETLEEGVDYEIESGGKATNVRPMTLRLAGLGDYRYNLEVEWSLQKATPALSDFDYASPDPVSYGETAVVAPPTLKAGKTGIGDISVFYYVNGEDTPEQPTMPGRYSIKFQTAEGSNFKASNVFIMGTLVIEKIDWTGETEFTGTFSSKGGTANARLTLPDIPSGAAYNIGSRSGPVSVTECHLEGNVLVYSVRVPSNAGQYARITVDVMHADCYNYFSYGVTLTSVDPVLTGVSISTPPSKTTYYNGESFQKWDMKLQAAYDDGSVATISTYSAYEVSPEVLTTDTTEVIITYTENGVTKTAAQPVTVLPRDLADAVVNFGIQQVYDPAIPAQPVNIVQVLWQGTDIRASLTKGTDYEIVSGDTAKNVGEVTLVLRGIGLYTGEASAVWSLRHAEPKWQHFSASIAANPLTDVTYDGLPHGVPAPTSTFPGMGAVTAVKYNGITALPVDAGTYAVTFTVAQGTNYVGTTLKYGEPNTFTIAKADVAETEYHDTVSAKDGAEGKAFALPALPEGGVYGEPALSGFITAAAIEDGKLVYSASPSAAGATGAISFPVSGAKNYNDYELTVYVVSKDANLAGIEISTLPAKTSYAAGETFDPAGMVVTASYTDGSSNPVSGYRVEPDGALASGTASVTISYTEGGITKTAEVAITVNARALNDCVVALGTQMAYTGSEQNVVIDAVYWGADMLEEGTDYEITSGGSATDVGAVTLILTGKGRYSGTKTAKWTLQKAVPMAGHFDIPAIGSYTYTGEPIEAFAAPKLKEGLSGIGAVTVKYGSALVPPISAGDYAVTFSVAEGPNFLAFTGLAYGTLTIDRAPNPAVVREAVSMVNGEGVVDLKTYVSGFVNTPVFSIEGEAFGCSVTESGLFSTGEEAGTVIVKVTLPGNVNYEDSEGFITITVTATDPYLRRHTMRHGEKAVDISLHTNTGSLEVSGDEDAASPVLIATYDADGRFLGLLIVTGDSAIDSAAEEGELLKIFWTDAAGTPLDEAYSGEE